MIACSSDQRSWPLIVGGCHRSGTSLLRHLLNGHPNIFCPAEIKFFMDILCQYPDDPYSHLRLGRTIASLGLPQEVWLREFGAAFVRCYNLAAAKHNKSRWADKAPENTINIEYWEQLLGERFFFVFMVRHPFDTVASLFEARMNKVIPLDLEGKAKHVASYVTSARQYAMKNPNRTVTIRYEDIVVDTASTLTRALERIGEDFHQVMIDDVFADFHGLGLEDRKLRHHTEITSRNVGRWKRDFNEEEVGQLRRHLGATCEQFGYPTDR